MNTLLLNFLHDFSSLDGLDSSLSSSSSSSSSIYEHFAEKHLHSSSVNDNSVEKEPQAQEVSLAVIIKKKLAANLDNFVHPVAGLDCTEHAGPLNIEDAQEMVYWEDIPADSEWESPFLKKDKRQYLTFEPDGGGWNNIRMSMETVLTMALAMGRVLVLPPSQKMYLLGKGQATFNFADFFPLQELAEEHAGFEIISTQQFLEETMGKTRDTTSQEINFPPDNKKTQWDGDSNGIKTELAPWLRSVAVDPDWDPYKCIAIFPKNSDPQNQDVIQQSMNEILAEDGDFAGKMAYEHFVNKPTPVDASMKDRLREFLAQRKKLCIYDKRLQDADIIHFHGKSKAETGGRLLVHFYAFLFFQEWHTDLWMKRFVRDHVRYIDDIQCAAARIVHAIRSSKNNDKTDKLHQYDSFHIRRGDFQYKKTRISAEEIVAAAKAEIPVGSTLYIGTDERDKDFFKPLKEHGWNLLFLDDFKNLLGDINPNYYGMIDQLIVSRGRSFFGCWFSTFTGYINRIRGYHSQTNNPSRMLLDHNTNAEAYSKGGLPNSYYYTLQEFKTKMHDYYPIKQNFYSREFPTSWRHLDMDLFELEE